VARLIPVDSPDDPRLGDYFSLRDVQLRKHLEADRGLFLAEGEKVVKRAILAGYRPRSFLLTPRWLPGLQTELDVAGDVPCFVVSDEIAEAATGFHVHRGALASLERRPTPPVEDLLRTARRVVVVEDVVDHANLGALIRSAYALHWDAVLLSPRCADPLYRRSVKVAMGAVFSIPWSRLDEWYDAVGRLRAAGFATVALTPDPSALPLAAFTSRARPDKICVLVGSEGSGLSPRWLASADVRVCIDMAPGADSLNVAAAAAIALYALRSS
jgi:tRNA G18 (ribose-2'-O)-methylase SpoU